MTEQNPAIKAIIGLGNPGDQYYYTRHSIGFRILDAFAEVHHLSWKKNDMLEYTECETTVGSAKKKLYLIKPLTFMNSSGKVLSWLLKKGIKPEEILVVHDELEKKFGSLALKYGGSARGHNGLRSLITVMGENFWRLKCGIGRPLEKEDVAHYVLSDFSREEEAHLIMVFIEAVSDLEKLLR